MGLVNKPASHSPQVGSGFTQDAANDAVDPGAPFQLLTDDSELARRDAAKALRYQATGTSSLLAQLNKEDSTVVVEAILDSLLYQSRDSRHAEDIVSALLPWLPEMNAGVRNSAILFLSALPRQMEQHIPTLLADSNKDVQLYALDIVRSMNHPDTAKWLGQMLQNNLHTNVLISLLDRIGDFQAEELLEEVSALCNDCRDPLVAFSAQLTVQRLGGICGNL